MCGRYLENPQREDNRGVKLSRRDFAHILIASGFPDFARCRVDVYPFGSGFFIGVTNATEAEKPKRQNAIRNF